MNTDQVRSRLILAAALLGFLGVALGAFGAHSLEDRLTPDRLETFEIAVRYQLFHAVALLGLAGLAPWNARAVALAGRLMSLGVLIFAGSLYALVFTGIGLWGAVTPIGGLCFLAGWGTLAWHGWVGADHPETAGPDQQS